MKALLAGLDAGLKAAGAEAGSIVMMALALAILCAPLGAALWLALMVGHWAVEVLNSRVIAVILGAAAFAALYRYIWNARLHAAVRRAAAMLLSGG